VEQRGERLDIERDFQAPVEDLYRAWTDPERLRSWFRPIGPEARRVALDARPGGSFEVEFPAHEGAELVVAGSYRELAARRLVLEFQPRWGKTLSGRPSLVTVELVPRAGATTLVLRHEGLDPADRETLEVGWRSTRASARASEACGRTSRTRARAWTGSSRSDN
jgi:uncharacterized protein YndB with AHSA1/START domain